jgi:hypothetical protein
MSAEIEEPTELEVFRPGLFNRYVGVFFSPDLMFQGLRSRPHWAGALVLGGLLSAAGIMLLPPDLMLATMREQAMASGQPLPSFFGDAPWWLRLVFGAGAFVGWSIISAIFAGLVMLFFAILLGHEGTYRQYLAVVAHAHLVVATSTVLLIPVRIAGEDAQLLLSLGSFAVFLEPGYLLRLLGFVDLFGLWAWLLVALGAARIGRKKSWTFGAVVMLMIPVTMAALFGILGG